MPGAWLDALRFLKGWIRPPGGLRVREVSAEPEGGGPPVPATRVEPPERTVSSSSAPVGWVLLHGLTRSGREHSSLVRFTRALAGTGGRVLIPEIHEWTRMRFAPERAQAVIRGAVRTMALDPGTAPGGVVLVGFSFGAPQALLAGSDPALRPHLRGVVGWGGYADLERTVRFHFTGEHGWKDERFHTRPDPYGRWVVGANCLPLSPELSESVPVADALRRLALEAGARQVMAGDPALEPMRDHLRRGLPRRLRPLYDVFAPPRGRKPDRAAALEVVDLMVPAARRSMPLLDPIPRVETLPVPVRLHHGRSDTLIPFTETLRLAEALASRAPQLRSGVTGLFAHSGGTPGGRLAARVREGPAFVGTLAGILELGRGP